MNKTYLVSMYWNEVTISLSTEDTDMKWSLFQLDMSNNSNPQLVEMDNTSPMIMAE